MFSILGAKKKSLLGIDIGSSSVRVLELNYQGNSYVVEAYGKAPLPENVSDTKNLKDQSHIAEAITTAIKNAGTKTKQVAISVPDSSVITKVIQLEEGLSEDEMEELVVLEADKYIPYPIDEVSLDYQVLGKTSKNSTSLDVLVIASRAENVNTRVALLKECGLEAKVIDVESYAIERSASLFIDNIPNQGKDKTIAFFDIGEMYTQLTVLHNMQTVFSREELFGGKQLTEELMSKYNLSLADAREAKCKGTLPQDYLTAILEPFKEMISLQVRRALQFFFSTSQHSSIDMILLAGGTSLLPGLPDTIESLIEVPTMLVDPMSNMTFSKTVAEPSVLRRDSATLLIACGLALRKFEQ